MFVTNGKVFTTRDQNDLESLKKFAEQVFEEFSSSRNLETPLEPMDYYQETPKYACFRYAEGMTLTDLFEAGADYVALEAEDRVEKREKQQVLFKHMFTAEEHHNNAEMLASVIIERRQIKNEAKEIASQYKARIDEKDAQTDKYSNMVSNGYEMREEECRVFMNFQDNMKEFVSTKTNQIVKTEPLSHEDKQLFIQFPEIGVTAEN